MNQAQIIQAMQEEVLKNSVYQNLYEATMGLYQAACLDNHGQVAWPLARAKGRGALASIASVKTRLLRSRKWFASSAFSFRQHTRW